MTISTQANQTTVLGNGVTTSFSFGFIADSSQFIEVIYTDATNTQTTLLPSQYTLIINPPSAGQLWGIGGTVTYPIIGSPIANGTSLTISRILPYTQVISISNQGDFAPEVIEEMGDTLEMQIQQLASRTTQFRGIWTTNTDYTIGDIVQDGANGANTQNYYICAIANTSGVWATDLAAGDWSLSVSAVVPTGAITLSGDVSGTGTNAITTTIGANKVTNAELAQVAALTMKGNNTAGTTNVLDLTVAQIQTMLGITQTIYYSAIAGFLPSAITGNATTATMTVSAGQASDSTNTVLITKTNSTSWAASNGNAINGYSGGTTLPNSSTLHMYVCTGTSGTGVYAIPNSSFPLAAASAPAGYISGVRRIFSFNTSVAGAPLSYTPIEINGGGSINWLATQVQDVNVANQGTAVVSYTLSVPLGIKVRPLIRGGTASGSNNTIIFLSGDETYVLPTGTYGSVPQWDHTSTGTGVTTATLATPVLTTNTSGQIGVVGTAAGMGTYVTTRGWIDFRR